MKKLNAKKQWARVNKSITKQQTMKQKIEDGNKKRDLILVVQKLAIEEKIKAS
jgi:hypothetical protein